MKIVYVILGVALGVGVVLLLMNRKQPATQMFVSGTPRVVSGSIPQTPSATYQNEESWNISWSEDGLPTQIVVHRNAKRQ